MTTHPDVTRPAPTPPRRRRWLIPVASAATVAVLAGVGVALLSSGDSPDRTAGPTGSPTSTTSPSAHSTPPPQELELRAGTSATGRCLPVTAETLRRMPVAIDAVVDRMHGRVAHLEVSRWWRGGTASQRDAGAVEVVGMSSPLAELVDGVRLRTGGRYLVTATSEGNVTACGFSAAWSPRLERLYADAYGG